MVWLRFGGAQSGDARKTSTHRSDNGSPNGGGSRSPTPRPAIPKGVRRLSSASCMWQGVSVTNIPLQHVCRRPPSVNWPPRQHRRKCRQNFTRVFQVRARHGFAVEVRCGKTPGIHVMKKNASNDGDPREGWMSRALFLGTLLLAGPFLSMSWAQNSWAQILGLKIKLGRPKLRLPFRLQKRYFSGIIPVRSA
jgi:hypothetical protein